jgi:hypothetical protein
VFLLVSKCYDSTKPEELHVPDEEERALICTEIKIQDTKDLYVGTFYRPPDKLDDEYLYRLRTYMNSIPTGNGVHLWLGSDFNLPDIS